MPGVRSASAALPSGCRPLLGLRLRRLGPPDARPSEIPDSAFNVVEPEYFRPWKSRSCGAVLHGRRHGRFADVVIINESFARRWWPRESPLGKRIKQGFPQDDRPWREIVGVVGDVPQEAGPSGGDRSVPSPFSGLRAVMTLVARTARIRCLSLGPRGRHPPRRRRPVRLAVQPLTAYLVESVARRHFTTLLLGLFGALALMLASVGIYGVVSYGVSQRTREIGIRTALGAGPRDVLRLVIAQALRLAAVGMLVGGAAALGLTRFLRAFSSDAPSDPSTFGGVAALLTVVVLAACAFPARRALGVSPTIALGRSEKRHDSALQPREVLRDQRRRDVLPAPHQPRRSPRASS